MDEFWANLDYTIYSGDKKITAKEIAQQNELKKQQQQLRQQQSTDIVTDKPTSVVIDLEPTSMVTQQQNSSVNVSVSGSSSSGSGSASLKTVSSRDGMDNIVIKTEEKTRVTVGSSEMSLDTVNRTKNNIASAFIGNKSIESSRIKTDGNVNKDNNNNSGNNNNSSIVMYK